MIRGSLFNAIRKQSSSKQLTITIIKNRFQTKSNHYHSNNSKTIIPIDKYKSPILQNSIILKKLQRGLYGNLSICNSNNPNDLFEKIFYILSEENELVSVNKLLKSITSCGLWLHDPHISAIYDRLEKIKSLNNNNTTTTPNNEPNNLPDSTNDSEPLLINKDQLKHCLDGKEELIVRVLTNDFVIPDFTRFCREIDRLYRTCSTNFQGKVASYIPHLASYSADFWAVSLCTVDGQRYAIGDVDVPFTLQSASWPFNYALAVGKLGPDHIHRFINESPYDTISGQGSQPHHQFGPQSPNYQHHQNQGHHSPRATVPEPLPSSNPLINSGAILVASLLQSDREGRVDRGGKTGRWRGGGGRGMEEGKVAGEGSGDKTGMRKTEGGRMEKGKVAAGGKRETESELRRRIAEFGWETTSSAAAVDVVRGEDFGFDGKAEKFSVGEISDSYDGGEGYNEREKKAAVASSSKSNNDGSDETKSSAAAATEMEPIIGSEAGGGREGLGEGGGGKGGWGGGERGTEERTPFFKGGGGLVGKGVRGEEKRTPFKGDGSLEGRVGGERTPFFKVGGGLGGRKGEGGGEEQGTPFRDLLQGYRDIIADESIRLNSTVFAQEREGASDRTRALAHLLMADGLFPDGVGIDSSLDLYLKSCSLELNAKSGALLAAVLANGGICPVNGKRVLDRLAVRNTLSLMHACGMYRYSGGFAYLVGLPAKSAVSGVILLVVPNVMGICLWSPPLDPMGNSVRGLQFSKGLVDRFNFHHYDNLNAYRSSGGILTTTTTSFSPVTAVPRIYTKNPRPSPPKSTASTDAVSPSDDNGDDDAGQHLQFPRRKKEGEKKFFSPLLPFPAPHRRKLDPRLRQSTIESAPLVHLLFSAHRGDLSTLRRLKMGGARLDIVDYDGRTALHLAASQGRLDCARWLVENCRLEEDGGIDDDDYTADSASGGGGDRRNGSGGNGKGGCGGNGGEGGGSGSDRRRDGDYIETGIVVGNRNVSRIDGDSSFTAGNNGGNIGGKISGNTGGKISGNTGGKISGNSGGFADEGINDSKISGGGSGSGSDSSIVDEARGAKEVSNAGYAAGENGVFAPGVEGVNRGEDSSYFNADEGRENGGRTNSGFVAGNDRKGNSEWAGVVSRENRTENSDVVGADDGRMVGGVVNAERRRGRSGGNNRSSAIYWIRDRWGQTALDDALKSGHEDVVEYLERVMGYREGVKGE